MKRLTIRKEKGGHGIYSVGNADKGRIYVGSKAKAKKILAGLKRKR